MNQCDRLELTDSAKDIILKMADGNLGAMSVVVAILDRGAAIDPQSALGGLGPIWRLDAMGIYDERIWLLHKYVCRGSLETMIAVLRANQLGMLSEGELRDAIDGKGDGLDVAAIVASVKQRLPKFGQPEAVALEV